MLALALAPAALVLLLALADMAEAATVEAPAVLAVWEVETVRYTCPTSVSSQCPFRILRRLIRY